ncbi:hypothetical protein PG999_012832 [Apiospora kogelbergensis]|uniref:Uncharacterized protein n=1 Tax=Apiospora kogelbergensis TaxID=1337665 RepID=A0AAW0QDN2_9PEZI
MFKSIPLGYRITAILPFDNSDVCRDTMIGTPFMANRPVWVEIQHNTDRNKVFIFYVHPSFSGNEFLQSRREEWIYPARSRDAISCPLATFGTQLVRQPVFTSLCRSDGDDDLHVYVSIQEYAAYETQGLFEPLEDIPPGRLHKPRGSAPWVQKVLVVEVTSTTSLTQAGKHRFSIDVC